MSAEQSTAAGPLGRLLSKVAPVEPREVPAVLISFCLFFCVFAGYFAVRPVRETFATVLGRDRVADLFVITWIVSLAIIPIYGFLVGKFRRAVFLPTIYLAIALALMVVGLVLKSDPTNVAVAKFFYVFISVVNLFIISVFWSFLLELFTQAQSKRLFGFIAAGGTFGALAGPALTDLLVGTIGDSGVLFMGGFLFLLTLFFQRLLLNLWNRGDAPSASPAEAGASGGKVRGDRPIGGNPFAGFTKVLTTPYLLGIALFVVFISTVNTILYFEQIRLVEDAFPDRSDRTQFFARIDWVVQALTVLCQIFLTGRIASKLGLTTLLIIVPIFMIGGFLALAATGTLTALVTIYMARRVGEYAFVRPAREMLFGRLDSETKYKAKNVIDVPVYRGADALSAQVQNLLTASGSTPAHIAMMGAGVAFVWGINGWLLGRKADSADAAERAASGAGQAAPSDSRA